MRSAARRWHAVPDVDPTKTLRQYLDAHVPALERQYLEAVLLLNDGRISKSAESAGISRRTLTRKMKTYGLRAITYRGG